MTNHSIRVAGIEIPSIDPVFLTVVGVHVLLGLVCAITGLIAMLSEKRRGSHPSFGSIYFWCLRGVFVTTAAVAAVRWAEDYDLFGSWSAGFCGRMHGSHGAPPALEQLGQATYRRYGVIIRSAADGLLCGQRKEFAAATVFFMICLRKPRPRNWSCARFCSGDWSTG